MSLDRLAFVADDPIIRFLYESNEYKEMQNLVTAKAFTPHSKDKETSVFNLDPTDRNALWKHASLHGRQDKTVKAAAHISASAVVECNLKLASAIPPPKHAVINGWPFDIGEEAMMRAQRLSLQQFLSSRSILLMKL